MTEINTGKLSALVKENCSQENRLWLDQSIAEVISTKDTSKLYLTYSLLFSRIAPDKLKINRTEDPLSVYLQKHRADALQLARIGLLVNVLETDFSFFSPKVAQIIEVADRGEMITFLKFLVLLPRSAFFKSAAVEALRTNITPVFEAIALNNPYPSMYFNEQEWNQMYLKAAFMQLDLEKIVGVEERANADLARIISDYAHERWAASREIDPMIWKPTTNYLNEDLALDMNRLLQSENPAENRAAALCCYNSQILVVRELLKTKFPKMHMAVEKNKFNWKQLND